MTTFDFTIGMADVDAYAFLYYSQFVKYNERAATNAADCPLVLTSVEILSLLKPVRWGTHVSIHTFLCPGSAIADASTVRLIHAWVLGDENTGLKPTVSNASIASYEAPEGTAMPISSLREPPADHPLYNQLMACVRENRASRPEFPNPCLPLAAKRQRELRQRVYPDAIGYGGRLQPSVAMDLFERQRTAIIGGQPSLAALQAEDVSVVVSQLRDLRLLRPPRLGSQVEVVSSESVTCGGLIYDVQQRIVATDADGCDGLATGGDGQGVDGCIAECTVRMVFLREGKMSRPPRHIEAVIDARREKEPAPKKVHFAHASKDDFEQGLPSPSSVTAPLAAEMPRMSLCDLYDE